MSKDVRARDRWPASTYRLQMREAFSFADGASIAPYLKRLGITDCYLSPVLAAGRGSPHGYDLCDHDQLNPELGGAPGFRELSDTLRDLGMGLILDFVPNHMGIDETRNLMWRDVLENGPSSPYSRFFDIEWNPVKEELRGKLLLPILADQYGVTLDSGQLQIRFREGIFSLGYFDHDLPLNPRALPILLRHNMDSLRGSLPEQDPDLNEFLSILFHLDHLPAYTETDPVSAAERHREKEVAKRRLSELVRKSDLLRRHIENNVRLFNGTPGNASSFDLLHGLLEAQAYRLSSWRTAMHEINYRRFFENNELAGVRMEDSEVFEATHALTLQLIQEGAVTGLRLDHIDGLFNPGEYFTRLRDRCSSRRHVYILVEKILSEGECLSPDWAVHGTTGYDFMNSLNSLYVDSAGSREFARLYARFTSRKRDFRDVVYNAKKLVITTSMASELTVLAAELNRISESNRHFRDFTLDSLQAALVEVVACFPVYRTYFSPEGWNEFDERNVHLAVRRALRRNPAMESSVFDFIRQMLLPVADGIPADEYRRRTRFAMKFQQYTGPVQAKGVEDTAFYRHGPLLSLNEVGSDPSRFGGTPEAFHAANEDRLLRWPLSMLATATHDTKRGEDARARLNVLSEMAQEWRSGISRWARINSSSREPVYGEPAPDRSDEYFFYQALIGAWPVGETEPGKEFVARMREYMSKATKEKKVHTSWINPSQPYDGAVARFVERTLTGARSQSFLRAFLPFQQRVARLGAVNSLSQLVLKIASPGVADFYQGAELWDFSLVDPDNRRPVDFKLRCGRLDSLLPLIESCSPDTVGAAVSEMLQHWEDGRIKHYLTAAGLRARLHHSALFLEGEYFALSAAGSRRDHVVALARRRGEDVLIAIAPRLVAGLVADERWWPVGTEVWDDVEIGIPRQWAAVVFRDLFTSREIRPFVKNGEHIRVADALRVCPVALLLGRCKEIS